MTTDMSRPPALMLPMGRGDYEKGLRLAFMQSLLPILKLFGFTFGIEIKVGNDLAEWAKYCVQDIVGLGGRVTMHWPNGIGKDLVHKELTDALKNLADISSSLISHGLEAVTIHCAAAVSEDPKPDAGLERYNSPIGAEEMMAHIMSQVESLRKLNVMLNGIVHIENLDPTQFAGGGKMLPTFLELKTGTWKDLGSIARLTGVNTTVDAEHFFGAMKFFSRDGLMYKDLKKYDVTSNCQGFEADDELAGFAGYHIVKGYPPYYASKLSFASFVDWVKPRLFHLGGSVRAVDSEGRIDTHKPSFDDPLAKGGFALSVALHENAPRGYWGRGRGCGQFEGVW